MVYKKFSLDFFTLAVLSVFDSPSWRTYARVMRQKFTPELTWASRLKSLMYLEANVSLIGILSLKIDMSSFYVSH